MRRVITPERMRALERAYMAESGTPGIVLMERAAEAIVRALCAMTDGGALFLCGPGNNGGDGYAAARILASQGHKAIVWALSDPETLKGDARSNMLRCVEMGIPVQRVTEFPAIAPEGCGAVVDALFGTGLDRPLSGLYADAVCWMNACSLPVLAVDMPSGTPELMVRADATVTFHRMKPTHLLFPGRNITGQVTIADIGLPENESPDDFTVLEDADVPLLLPPRARDAHKGDCGHALIVAGSFGMAGAAALCAEAALRGGTGLVTVACPAEVVATVQALVPCAMCVTPEHLPDVVRSKSAAAAGPGLGSAPEVGDMLRLLLEAKTPQIWDADALNWLGKNPATLGGQFVITPHPGEAARLLGVSTPDIIRDPIAAAERLYQKYGATVLLKGATTVIIGAEGRALNITGTPGMATGGSGDVLSGIIAALLAQGLSSFDAARVAAFLHGKAGEAAATLRGIRSMTAGDLLAALRID